ncbi:zinc ABC transporter substrate-binding protein [candidate division WOR-3 bacterium]|nr:zinc ABC transporter substrate-binding protein [candidate division WOR-3 bacterium]
MNTRCALRSVIALFLVFGFASVACREDDTPHDRVTVAVSIPPLADLVKKVGGDHVQVITMVPSGASPHTYEPTPAQMALLSEADLYIKVGTPIEFELVWLDKMLAINHTMHVCDASDGIFLISTRESARDHADDDAIDPHIWVSVRNAQTMIGNISRALASIDPQHATLYHGNMVEVSIRLDSLDRAIVDMLAQKKQKIFIVYHSAWNYFARDYGLEQKTIEAGGKEPSARTIEHIIETARQFDIHVLFASPQFDRKYAESIARDIDGQVVLVDPLAENYIDTIRTFAAMLARYLE